MLGDESEMAVLRIREERTRTQPEITRAEHFERIHGLDFLVCMHNTPHKSGLR